MTRERAEQSYAEEVIALSDEAKILWSRRPESSGCNFATHGGAAIERFSALGSTIARSVYKHSEDWGISLPNSTLVNGSAQYTNSDLRDISLQNGDSFAVLEALPAILNRTFSIPKYSEIVRDAYRRITEKEPVKYMFSESVATLAALDLITENARLGIQNPELVCLVNTPIGGLLQGADWFLEKSGQFDQPSVPALSQLRKDSDYLIGLREKVYANRMKLPDILVIACVKEIGTAAVPWSVIEDGKLAREMATRGFGLSGDGMFNEAGLLMYGEILGQMRYLLNPSNSMVIRMEGLVHSQSLRRAIPYLEAIASSRLTLSNKCQGLEMSSDPVVVDVKSGNEFTNSVGNKIGAAGAMFVNWYFGMKKE